MSRSFLFSCILLLAFSSTNELFAQLNLYSRLTDPRAIAKLDCEDCEPLQYATRFGYPPDRDPIDSNFILAQDTGAGIITHIWFTFGMPDSTTNFKLYVDDSLLFSNTGQSFFLKAHGLLRPPFDTTYPGAYVCDVQIPFTKNFKITFIGEGWNFYYAIAWRPLHNAENIHSFQLTEPYSMMYHQQDAENIYEALSSPWAKEKNIMHFFDTLLVPPGARMLLREMQGPAMIQQVKFSFSKYDFDVLDSVWVNIYWDGSPYPAVHVPVSDFFCSSNGGMNVKSFDIRTDSSGLTSYFSMPFATSAKFELINQSKDSLKLRVEMDHSVENINKNSYGYFHASFHEENPTRYHIYYDALHVRGRGKYVGFYLYSPHNTLGVILEGAPIFTIDSNDRNFIHYTGGEDYYNSGWWFIGLLFCKPFAGHLNFFQSFFRFHLFDAIDFKKSLDLKYQPGKAIDIAAHFRSVAYYYKQPVSFWVSRDTIRAGERWNVSGSGYTPNATITAQFDGTQTIFTTTANSSGNFNAVLIVPNSSIHGARLLSINGEIRPEPIYVLQTPAIQQIADSLPVTLRYRDSLLLTGTGFDPGEKIQIFLDSILISGTDTITVGNDYRFFATVRMPNIAEWKYHLRAVGDHHNEAMSSDLITMTRLLPFEFEDLVPWAIADSGWLHYQNLSAYWGGKWSHQAAAICESTGPKKSVRFKFYIPASDSFYVQMLYALGPKYGNYSYSIDGKYYDALNAYKYSNWDEECYSPDTLKLGTIFFAKDTHTVTFTCIGKDSAAKDYKLGADLLLLTPTTKMALPKGVFTISPNDSIKSIIDSPDIINSYIIAYPNPATGAINLGIRFLPGITDGTLDISLSDIIGRRMMSSYNIPIGATGGSTQFDVHSLPPGNYVAEFIIHSGSLTQRISRLVQIRE